MYNLESGIREIWREDYDYQMSCLVGIVKNIRNITDEKILNLHVEYLKKQGAFFVHNDTYMVERFGQFIKDPRLAIYRFDHCSLVGRLAIPIIYMDGSVQGFIGYSKKPKELSAEDSFIKYLYPSKEVFNKARYFYITSEEYIKAVQDGYVCIVDGIFDKIILQCLGINAVSLCGSALTKWHQYYLRFIKNKIVIADNDVAGRKLADNCKRYLTNCVEIIQPYSNDVDSFLRNEPAVKVFLQCFDEMQHEGFTISHNLPKVRKERVNG